MLLNSVFDGPDDSAANLGIPDPWQLLHVTVTPEHPWRCVPAGQHVPADCSHLLHMNTLPPPWHAVQVYFLESAIDLAPQAPLDGANVLIKDHMCRKMNRGLVANH